jgi:hypothetical protein
MLPWRMHENLMETAQIFVYQVGAKVMGVSEWLIGEYLGHSLYW